MSENRLHKINARLDAAKGAARFLEGERRQMEALASVLLSALVEPGQTLRVAPDEWKEALDNPRVVLSMNREDGTDWGLYLTLKEDS